MDIRKFFDSVPWDVMLRAVAHHADQSWILRYVERWLKAPLQREEGGLVERGRGTPQGSAISPLLAKGGIGVSSAPGSDGRELVSPFSAWSFASLVRAQQYL